MNASTGETIGQRSSESVPRQNCAFPWVRGKRDAISMRERALLSCKPGLLRVYLKAVPENAIVDTPRETFMPGKIKIP